MSKPQKEDKQKDAAQRWQKFETGFSMFWEIVLLVFAVGSTIALVALAVRIIFWLNGG